MILVSTFSFPRAQLAKKILKHQQSISVDRKKMQYAFRNAIELCCDARHMQIECNLCVQIKIDWNADELRGKCRKKWKTERKRRELKKRKIELLFFFSLDWIECTDLWATYFWYSTAHMQTSLTDTLRQCDENVSLKIRVSW